MTRENRCGSCSQHELVDRLQARVDQLEAAIYHHAQAVGSQDDLPPEVVAINRHLWSAIQ